MLLSLLLPILAYATELNFEPNTSVWGIASAREISEGRLNPLNLTFRQPDRTLSAEVRPDWNLSSESGKLTARPRLILLHERVKAGGLESWDTDLRLRWSEGFASWNASDSFTLSYGLQNYQWGPAESASPSNRIIRDTVQVKDTIYAVKGHHLLRLTYAPSAAFSEVLLVELSDNGDEEPEAYESYSRKALLKTEISWGGGADYAALVLGWRDKAGLWLGEVLNLEPLEGFSIYADASHQRGSLAWYPSLDSTGRYTLMSQGKRGDDKVFSFLASGVRYAFENGNDLRVEYLFQEAGWTGPQRQAVISALTSTDPIQALLIRSRLQATLKPGLDFPGQQYLFSSFRSPNSFSVRDWTIYLRYLHSLEDSSGSAYLSHEYALGDNSTILGSFGAAFGSENEELKGVVDFAATLAYRHSW